jgi:K+-transporting ATPase KdpF subunit
VAFHLFEESIGEKTMNLFYLIGGVLSLGVLIYLLIALLKPEVFS